MAYGLVYLVRRRLDGMSYVGITTGGLKSRWRSHCREAKRGARWRLHRAIKKCGADEFEVQELEQCPDRESLERAERFWINELGTFLPAGFNMTLGGGGVSGFKRSEEFKREVSQRFTGRKVSAEARAKMSISATGRKASAAARAKMSMLRKGRQVSAETRHRISKIHKGKKLSAAQVSAMRERMLGTSLSASAREKISRPVIAAGTKYQSLSAAAESLGVDTTTVARRISSGAPGYESLRPVRKRRPRDAKQREAMRARSSKPVIAAGKLFASATIAAGSLGIARSSLAHRIRAEWPGYGVASKHGGLDQNYIDRPGYSAFNE